MPRLLVFVLLFTACSSGPRQIDHMAFERFAQTVTVLVGNLDGPSGCGFLLQDTDVDHDYVLTARHVVVDIEPGQKIVVALCGITRALEFVDATIVALDEYTDLALLTIRSTDRPGLVIAVGDPEPGALVFAAGVPFVNGEIRAPALLVRAVVSKAIDQPADLAKQLVRSASSWPGFSGCPVLDPRTWRVVGINQTYYAHPIPASSGVGAEAIGVWLKQFPFALGVAK